ncbi:MAG: glutamate--cysteine ligase [Acidimicrobiales bacterium]|jgi:carboxylate-amine ligase|nr:glutamate--cysteine ligase [Acidimicrobiales bacterium]
MEITFNASPRPTLGVELELCVVDLETRELVAAATEVIERLEAARGETPHPKVKHELFECTLEIITGVCETVAEARADLRESLEEVASELARRRLGLVCAGTHPFSHWQAQQVSPSPRYADLVARIGWPARRLAIYGVHFHVGVDSGEKAVAVVNALAVHLPVFVALSASSPFWHGFDTSMASCRTKVFEALPTAGLPPRLASWAEFESMMDTLVNARAVSSIREVWWDIRPHPDFGTVELRMCDGLPSLDEVAALAALAQSLVADLSARFDAGEQLPGAPEWVLRQNKWLAARHGLDAELLVGEGGALVTARQAITELVEQLRPTAETLGCAADLEGVLRILEVGPSYERQRRIVDGGGTHADVVDSLVRELHTGRDA